MSRPVIGRLVPFIKDSAPYYTINFTYGGAQSFKNKITVYDATNGSNMSVVYENTITTMQYSATIPSDNLRVNTQYAVEIICYDKNDVPSTVSEKAYFWCLTAPTFRFDEITDNNYTIRNASYKATVTYEQVENERIRQYRFYLYDFQKALLTASEVMYDETNMSYTFKGFENMSDYYIRCVALTERDIVLDTGYVHIYVQYALPQSYSTLNLKSENGDGIVEYHTNLVVIEATRDDYDYIDGMVDLEDDVITYKSRFIIDGDFTMAIRHMFKVGKLMTCSNSEYGMTLDIIDCGDGEYRYRLRVPNGIANYTLWSEPFTHESQPIMLTCWIRRINNVYKLVFFKTIIDTRYGLILGADTNGNGVPRDPVNPAPELKDVFIDDNNVVPTARVTKDNLHVYYTEERPDRPARYDIWIGGDDI